MPELPEVETLCRQLRQVALGRLILNLEVLDQKLGAGMNPSGQRIRNIRRIGKAIEVVLEGELTLKIHLRMTGRLYWQEPYHMSLPHTRFVLTLSNGVLSCVDPRRFATLSFGKSGWASPPADDSLLAFHPVKLWCLAQRRKLPIKSFLLDQRVIAGIGNIYACEILHAAAIHPQRKAETLSLADWRRLGDMALNILQRAIACRGTTLSDWRDLFGKRGEYQACLRVYRQEGRTCFRCGKIIRRVALQGRGTYFCASCQI